MPDAPFRHGAQAIWIAGALILATSGAAGGHLEAKSDFRSATADSISIRGSNRIKVGDPSAFTSVSGPGMTGSQGEISWTVVSGAATLSFSGSYALLTATAPGAIELRVAIDHQTQSVSVIAYDWLPVDNAGHIGLTLSSDRPIRNEAGRPRFATLSLGCSQGRVAIAVVTNDSARSGDPIRYTLDGSREIVEQWEPLANGIGEQHPGPNGPAKMLLRAIAISTVFGFAYTDQYGSRQIMAFRVGGLANLLPPILAACAN